MEGVPRIRLISGPVTTWGGAERFDSFALYHYAPVSRRSPSKRKPYKLGGGVGFDSSPGCHFLFRVYMYNKPFVLKIDKKLGYMYFIDKDHPLANSQGKVYYHRHIMSLYINRWISRNEIVHHKDKNKQNNSIENLEILSNIEHSKLHNKKQKIYLCIICGKESNTKHHKYCSKECYLLDNKSKIKPSKEQLESDIQIIKNWCAIGRKYNVSDNCIRKWARKYNLIK